MSTDLINLLRNTLTPGLLESTQNDILRARSHQGFATDLMVIADDIRIQMNIRQSALVVLKNLFADQCSNGNIMNKGDWQIIKQNILQALIRTWGQKQLTPTLRQIIHLIAEKDFPQKWPQIVDSTLNYISNASDFNSVASSVQALKAVVSVCGGSLSHQITTSNLCNKIVFPLFQLANKLFQNFSVQTLPILASIFKIFNLSIFYTIPQILMNNIHSLMIFLKKILQIQQMQQISPLKIVCLKILARLYSRHTSANTSYKLLSFAQNFHQKYSTAMTETLMLQLLDCSNSEQIIGLSLNCLMNIYKNQYAEDAVKLIHQQRYKIIQTCLQRYKTTNSSLKNKQSIGSYITCIKEQRSHFVEFVIELINVDTSILGEFINNLNEGDEKIKEISLYMFSAISEQVQQIPQLHANMNRFIIDYILPILNSNMNSDTMLKARGCEIISNYIYLNLPEEQLKDIFQFIYVCLTEIKQTYLNIYALEAFTKMIVKYEQFTQFIIPYLQGILKKYTQLLKQSNGQVQQVIQSFQSFIGQLNGKDLRPFANNLIKFLTQLFYDYQKSYQNQNQSQNYSSNNSDNTGQDQSLSDQQQDVRNASQGCLACIRQILSVEDLPQQLYVELCQPCILPLILSVLTDRELEHYEQALNLLNLIVFKLPSPLPESLINIFPVFAYSVLGLPQQLLDTSSNISGQYKTILANVCLQPDQDIVANIIGVLRNYVVKLGGNQLRSRVNQFNSSYMQQIFKIVRHVHTGYNDQQQKFIYKNKGDRSVILTLYTTLLEHNIAENMELQAILQDLVQWSKRMPSQTDKIQYFENILVAINFYGPAVFSKIVDFTWFISQLNNSIFLFRYDYQLQRLVIGITKLIQIGAFNNNSETGIQLVRILPDILCRLYELKQNQTNNNNTINTNNQLIDAQQQAQQDLIQQNTHMGLLPNQQPQQQPSLSNIQQQQNRQLYAKMCEQVQWDEQYNKYYFSPLDAINQIQYLTSVLQNSQLFGMLSQQEQGRLGQYLGGVS